jgi:2',3'-cyclic-nucleotide 2'-phosphodiesterase (5'-nucleotidase family)
MIYANISLMKAAVCIGISLLLLSVLFVACDGPEAGVVILHTGDIHGHLENMPGLAGAIAEVRAGADGEDVLLFDTGDVFYGSVYGMMYGDQASLWFMNRLGYDAMCLGDSDFDEGLDGLLDFVEGAEFDVVSSNLEFGHVSGFHGLIMQWRVIEKNGERYGIFGLLTRDTLEIAGTGLDIDIGDYKSVAAEMVAGLESQGVDKIIALTHIGWDNDLELAGEVEGIDIIIGGYTHTLPEIYPYVVDEEGTPTLVVHAGENGEYLGCLDVAFDAAGVISGWEGSRLIAIDDTVDKDAAFVEKLAEYQAPLETMLSEIIGRTLVDLDGERENVRSRETNLGNLVADSMLHAAEQFGADVAIINAGGIRGSIPAGDISLETVISVLPFDNYLVTLNLTGEQIVTALENGVSRVEDVQGRFPQVAGLRFRWDPQAEPGSRILSVEIKKGETFEPVNPAAVYRIVTSNFLYQGGDGYTVFTAGTDFVNTGYTDYEVLADYISANSPVYPRIEGRIISE